MLKIPAEAEYRELLAEYDAELTMRREERAGINAEIRTLLAGRAEVKRHLTACRPRGKQAQQPALQMEAPDGD